MPLNKETNLIEQFVGNFIFKRVRTNFFAHYYRYCFYTVKWFQLLLSNAYNSIQHYSFIYTVKCFKVLLQITYDSIKHQSCLHIVK